MTPNHSINDLDYLIKPKRIVQTNSSASSKSTKMLTNSKSFKSFDKMSSLTDNQIKISLDNKSVGQLRVRKVPNSNLSFLNMIIWMIILLSQSTKGNSVFLESCSANNINQVFCHKDQLYVIQDSVLYYGNSCGQMMTNETIRVTKKFKTAVSMKTAFIDEQDYILLFSNNLVLTSSLITRNVANLHNISQVVLDYHGTIKYSVFEPTLKHLYVVDNENKLYIFHSKSFSHTGSIKWGKVNSQFNSVDLDEDPFYQKQLDYFFFVGRDLYYKLIGLNKYGFIANFGSCLKQMAEEKVPVSLRNYERSFYGLSNDYSKDIIKYQVNDPIDFQKCFQSLKANERVIPLKVLVCTEIQYIIFVIFVILMLLILLFCCLSCCYNYITDREKGGESYYVKENEDRFLKKLFKKYPKDKFDQFMKLYQRNEVNPVKLDPDQIKNADLEVGDGIGKKNEAYQAEYPTDIKHPIKIDYQQSNAPVEIKVKHLETPSFAFPIYTKPPIKKEVKEPEIIPRQLKSKEFQYVSKIPVNQNNNNLVFIDSNSNFERNFERASLILEDYAENKPDIDLKEPRPYCKTDSIKPKIYQPYRSSLKSNEHIAKTYNESNKQIKEYYQKSNQQLDYSDQQNNQQYNYSSSKTEVKNEFSIRNIVPNFLNLFSPLKKPLTKSGKDPMTKF